jgi:hypothetical protein
MVERLRAAEERAQQFNMLNAKLLAETEMLREEAERHRTELAYYRNFTIEMVTNLGTIDQTIRRSIEEARKHGVRLATARKQAVQPNQIHIEEEPVEADEVPPIVLPPESEITDIFSRLPKNEIRATRR